jgi:hypothetical protein
MKKLLSTLGAALLVGCASTSELEVLSSVHPASKDAAESPLPPAEAFLQNDSPVSLPPEPTAKGSQEQHHQQHVRPPEAQNHEGHSSEGERRTEEGK